MFRVFWICFLLLFFEFQTIAHAKIVQTNKPYTYGSMENDLHLLKAKYKENVEIRVIGYTHFGRKVSAVKLGKGEKSVLLVGAHHGREWITSMLLMKMLETYSADYQKDLSQILNEVSIWFVPMLNPDGVTIQQNNIREFPPDQQNRIMFMNEGWDHFIRWKANGLGIDLNRQYPADWEALTDGPNVPSYQFYKGKSPFEAEEVIALSNFVKEIKPLIAVSYHSAGREIYWKYKNGENFKRDRRIAKRIAKITGYKLGKPPKEAVGGGFTDWFITTYHRPALTIEISYLVGDRHPPLCVFKEEWKRNKNVGLVIAEEAKY
ncbi:M14 family zinc carboxypeptidase [Neobacillus sp. PS3-40]|uniref:M14 family zinc carboxypeptidase n=1 Tax=Neobacillus sp. PS3-40 TaxID=3070679 RepID=UPI0027E0B0AA|nr:M14 family zinc carboxypeptidase [Neobacillus sp. PS3-40]WML43184.1 M14 family zinc carboxypeptidase [Neobacillus sp. PS3-40]